MSNPTSRQGLIDYCLRKLGHPVIEINVDDDQLEDRIDEALGFYREFHYDAVELVYLKHQITQADIDNQYLTINDAITGVTKIFPFSNRTTGINIFDIRYQILINDLYSLMSTDLIYYSQVRQHLELINMMLIGQKPIRFNRHMNRLFIDMDWEEDVDVGDYIVIECYRILDPDTYTDVYNDRILKKYAAALIKRQWGANLKKFSGVQLPGGVQLNGQVIFDEAMQEIKEIEEETRNTYELPVDMFVG
ncbi:MAG: hypothetical protein ACO3UU_05055 [Minisyncoccia bacterium]